MTGSLRLSEASRWPKSMHVHCVWTFADGPSERLIFADPRRFGGLWSFSSVGAMHNARWDVLGPDALDGDERVILERLAATSRSVKSALLDQHVLAGVGNIYADEALHRAGIHPLTRSSDLSRPVHARLLAEIRTVMTEALELGGSTVRDYRGARGEPGTFVKRHRVYARAGHACVRCGETLQGIRVSQRATVFCARCQSTPVVCVERKSE